MMIHDPQYLIGSDADKAFKEEQQKLAKGVFKENKEVRMQLNTKRRDLLSSSLTIRQCGRLGVKKAEIIQWEKEGKIKGVLYKGKMYYSREDIANCM